MRARPGGSECRCAMMANSALAHSLLVSARRYIYIAPLVIFSYEYLRKFFFFCFHLVESAFTVMYTRTGRQAGGPVMFARFEG